MKIREKSHAHFVVFVLGATMMPAQADERPASVTEKLASRTCVIPKNLIEMIYKPNYSGVPNPNPNWPHDPVVRLVVRWPEFTASIGGNTQENAKRKIIISLRKGTTRTIAQSIESLSAQGLKPEISAAQYGLKEFRSDLSRNFREYIASPEYGSEFLIHCTQLDPARLYSSCNYDFEYFGLEINVYFASPFLSNWQEIHQKTVALLNSIRKD